MNEEKTVQDHHDNDNYCDAEFFITEKEAAMRIMALRSQQTREREKQSRQEPWTMEDLKEAGIPESYFPIAQWYDSMEQMKELLNL